MDRDDGMRLFMFAKRVLHSNGPVFVRKLAWWVMGWA